MSKIRILLAALILLVSGQVGASVIYGYKGNPLTWQNDGSLLDSGLSEGISIRGFISLDDALAPNLTLATVTPTLYEFSDTVFTHTITTDVIQSIFRGH